MTKEKKKEANEFGRKAEEEVAERYLKQGYTIIERNWRLGKIEIDLIVQKDDVIVLIEVKAREEREEDALSAVDRDKRKRMIKAADVYIRNLQGQYDYRFDIATCIGDKENFIIEIYEDAFVAADIY